MATKYSIDTQLNKLIVNKGMNSKTSHKHTEEMFTVILEKI